MDKKKILTIVGIVVFVAVVILSIVVNPSESQSAKNELTEDATVIMNNAQSESANIKDSDKGEFNQIDVDTYLMYLNGEEAKLVMVARPTCSYCQIAEPIVQKLIHDYNVEINYLNTDNFEGDDQINFLNSAEAFKEGFGTPMLLLVQKGSLVDTVDGLTDTAHYTDFLQRHGFIK